MAKGRTAPSLPDLWVGRILKRASLVTDDQLKLALAQRDGARTLAERLVDLRVMEEDRLYGVLSAYLRIPFVRVQADDVLREAVDLVPEKACRAGSLLPISAKPGAITVATANPANHQVLRLVGMTTGRKVAPVLITWPNLLQLYQQVFDVRVTEEAFRVADDVAVETETLEAPPLDDWEHEREPIVRLVNLMIADAIRMGASDLHLEPRENSLAVRCRVDGLLRDVAELPRRVLRPVVSRIKVMARLDISDQLRPHDGQTRVRIGAAGGVRNVELRVATIPSVLGEKVVVRILDGDDSRIRLEHMGFSPVVLEQLQSCLDTRQGLLLVTGPTGSGKTTTLYCCLRALRSPEVSIVTVEDPVEYRMRGITQVAVRPQTGLTFASALRSILRLDPDIILVGEVRDAETAGVAVQASMTGHLVLSTLHTNDAVSTILRLGGLGVEPFRVASSLLAVSAQRLLRRVCSECRQPADPKSAPEFMGWLDRSDRDASDVAFHRSAGCKRCGDTGYAGRLAVAELLVMTDQMRKVIQEGVSEELLKLEARASGMIPVRDDALAHVADGDTTLDEVIRVLGAPPEAAQARPQLRVVKTPKPVDARASEASVAGDAAVPDQETGASAGDAGPRVKRTGSGG